MPTDIYGRPLPEPAWHDTPPENGWYFYAPDRKDFDLARPIGVHKIEDSTGVRLEAQTPNGWLDVREFPAKAVWYGPFRLARPPWAK
jgi:hypothetical protein